MGRAGGGRWVRQAGAAQATRGRVAVRASAWVGRYPVRRRLSYRSPRPYVRPPHTRRLLTECLMSDYESLRWELEDHVATITLDRPEKKNAMSFVMFNELRDAFLRAAGDDEVRCVVVTGAGGAFCSGADLSDPANMSASTFEFKERMRL